MGLTGGVGLGFHVGAEDGVDAGLVAFAVLFEPLDDVVVDADGETVFWFGQVELGGGPEGFAELGDVGEVDFGIAQGAQAFEVSGALEYARVVHTLHRVKIPLG
jgi:hypothetical protein